jgi:threonyl-tRNA synthetase
VSLQKLCNILRYSTENETDIFLKFRQILDEFRKMLALTLAFYTLHFIYDNHRGTELPRALLNFAKRALP